MDILESKKTKMLFKVFILLFIYVFFLTSILWAADYFVAQGDYTGWISVNPVTGNIAVSDDTGVSVYSASNFSQIYNFQINDDNISNIFSPDGLFLYTCIADTDLDFPNEPGRFSIINLSSQTYDLVWIDRYPNQIIHLPLDDILYVCGGLYPGTIGKLFKIDFSSQQILYETECGSKPAFTISHDNSKVYVLDDDFYWDINDEGLPAAGTYHSKVEIYDASDLLRIGEIRISYEGNYIIQGQTGELIISHNPSQNSVFPSLTIIDIITDDINREISFQDTGFVELVYDSTQNLLYGAMREGFFETAKSYYWASSCNVGAVNLNNDSLVFIEFEDEHIGPIALSPDKTRLYGKSLQSNKVYYVDLF